MLNTTLKKEAKQLLSDKGFLIISLLQPIVFILMFGSSFQSGDINHLDTIIIDADKTQFSQYVIHATQKSEFFDIINFSGSFDEAISMLNKSKVRAVIYIPKDFEKNINNTIAGNIKIYLDSSNFLTYSSLSGAQVEIAKDSLQNITNDILGELEIEKEDKKEKVEEIKNILKDIEKEADILDINLETLRNQTGEGSNLNEFEKFIRKVRSSIRSAEGDAEDVQIYLDNIITTLESMESMNASDEIKKTMIVQGLSGMITEFNNSIEDNKELREKLEDIDFPEINTSLSKDVENRLNYIREMFEDVSDKSEAINFDFKKLEKKFLSEPIKIDDIAMHGPIKYFDYLGAGVLSLIVFFVCLMAPTLNIISEKEKNTLYRLSTTPVSSTTVFMGKFLVFLSFGLIEMFYTLFLAIWIYDLRITGSIYAVIFILSLLACASISIGLLISSRVKTMQQALVIVPLIVIPSFMISHSFFPPDIMADFMNYIAYITPMTFSNHALNAIMIKGFTLNQLIPDILALLGFAIIPLFLFIWSYRRIKY